ncbi:MAG: LysR substrate-binding domain-containing protein [Pseudomonadota bacterium]
MSEWLPSLNALRAFECVSRHLNFAHAAEELSVTPAAVKQLVGKLEAALGSKLVVRDGRGLALTAAGRAGRDGLASGFSQISSAVGQMRAQDARQRLIVSVEPSFATAWLVPKLEGFRTQNGHVDVLIDSSLKIADLQHGAADLAIRFAAPAAPGLVCRRLFDEMLCIFCSPALTQGDDALRTLDDLAHTTLLHWDLSEVHWAVATKRWMEWRYWLAEVGAAHVPTGTGLMFSDYNLAVQAAIAGQGVVLGSLPVLQSLVEAGLLVCPFPERVQTDIGYDVVTTEATLKRPEARRFLEWITREAGAQLARA